MIKDLTRGNPLKLIVLFALPILVGNLFQQLFHISDILIVGRLLGVEALAAVGSSAPLIFMFLMITFGFTAGLTIITAQRFGAKDYQGVKSSVFHSTLAALLLSSLISLFLVIYLRPMLKIMNIPPQIMEQAYTFTFILGISMVPVVLYNLLSGFIRALGDSKTPLYFLIFCSLINILLNFVFIYYCGLGVAGSALGSCCSMILTVIACIVIIIKKFPLLQIKPADCHYNHRFMLEHLKVAAPMAVQFSILSLSMMIIQSVCNSFGTKIIAGFTAALRIEQVSTQPVFAIGVAFATYAAQNYGAALIKRIRQGVRQSLVACLVMSIIITLSVRFYGTQMVGMFIADSQEKEQIASIGQQYLLISSYFYFFLACIFITRNALQGMGRAGIPLASGIFELIIRACAAIFLAGAIGYKGIFLAGPIAWVGGAMVTAGGYWWIINNLNYGDMRKIFKRRQKRL